MAFIDVDKFIGQQMAIWPFAAQNYKALKEIEQRRFDFANYSIIAQHNPARITSSGAKVDKTTITKRPCFLCHDNRPKEQLSIDWNEYEILINPYPIFDKHLTIVSKRHSPQSLSFEGSFECERIIDMFELAKLMPQMAIFYNGANCGASAPDHMHFQAGNIDNWPIFDDFKITDSLLINDNVVKISNNIGRQTYCITANNATTLQSTFKILIKQINANENMMNIIVRAKNNNVETYIIPRKQFRPWQYTAADDEKLLISPASVEVGGIFIVPIKEHFDKLNSNDIQDILKQICY